MEVAELRTVRVRFWPSRNLPASRASTVTSQPLEVSWAAAVKRRSPGAAAMMSRRRWRSVR